MNTTRLTLLKAKLKAAKADWRLWTREHNRAERALLRIDRQIAERERKIESELAKAEQRPGAAHGRAGPGAAQ